MTTIEKQKERYLKLAQLRGSRATTLQGAKLFFRKLRKSGARLDTSVLDSSIHRPCREIVIARKTTESHKSITVDEYRELQRAKNDSKFRNVFIDSLIRRGNKLNPRLKHTATLEEMTRAADSTVCVYLEQQKINWLLDEVTRTPDAEVHVDSFWDPLGRRWFTRKNAQLCMFGGNRLFTPPNEVRLISLEPYWKLAKAFGYCGNLKAKDSKVYSTFRSSYHIHEPGETTWKGNRPISYARATSENYVRSFAVLRGSKSQVVEVAQHTRDWSVTAPDGCWWAIDELGLYLTDGEVEWHPTVTELWVNRFDCSPWWEVRRAQKWEQKVKAVALLKDLERDDIWVCASDSLRAGNCFVGTKQWVFNRGLDLQKHYPARLIVKRFKNVVESDYRVRCALVQAKARHDVETQAGVCWLKEHTLNAQYAAA